MIHRAGLAYGVATALLEATGWVPLTGPAAHGGGDWMRCATVLALPRAHAPMTNTTESNAAGYRNTRGFAHLLCCNVFRIVARVRAGRHLREENQSATDVLTHV